MPKTKLYYTLISLVRAQEDTPQYKVGTPLYWQIEFGDYDRATVKDEMEYLKESTRTPLKDMKIISTDGTDAEIYARVKELNSALKH